MLLLWGYATQSGVLYFTILTQKLNNEFIRRGTY